MSLQLTPPSVSLQHVDVLGLVGTSSLAPTAPASLTPSQVMLWLESQKARLDGRARELMSQVNGNTGYVEALDTLRAELGGHHRDVAGWGTASSRIDAFLAKYGEHLPPQVRADLESLGGEMATAQAAWDAAVARGDDPNSISADDLGAPKDDQLDAVMGSLQSTADRVRTDDQMVMLQLKDVMDKKSQVEELASNVVKALNDSAKATVENIR